MPIYEYRCGACDRTFEELLRSSNEKISCPSCASPDVKRLLSDRHRSTSHGFVRIFGRRFRGDRHQTRHFQTVAGEADEIFFVVRKETHLAHRSEEHTSE